MGLQGRTVVVTRPRAQGAELANALEARGARVVEIPSIAILPPDDWGPLDRALGGIGGYDLVLFGSKNAAEPFFARAAARGVEVASLRYGCVGKKTAAWLARRVTGPIVVPEVFRGEAFAAKIRSAFGGELAGRTFLIPEADRARGEIGEQLRALGAIADEVVVYKIGEGPAASAEQIAALDTADAVTFLSGQTIECFLRVVPAAVASGFLGRAAVAVIGPVAAETAAGLGVRVDVIPSEATVEGLAAALDRHFGP